MFYTRFTHNVGCPKLVLITQDHFEVGKISTLYKITDCFPVML